MDKSTDEPFGVCGLQFTKLQGETVLNIYYRIATEKTRKGYVKEAITCIMEHVLMLTENRYRMLILTKVNNVPSIKTAESLGFIYDLSLDDYEEKGNVYFFNR
ncbi:GNAT family N-acetyltransferase [Staphylococcus sp. IVB6246]|uniref:GNAT family N-acetyltransferase n=1 Tax=unclassified Staphylococcus TaxID=91994 RepID=UPI0021D1DC98|nr:MULTISPECIES: GNAT family protein [unclassified Staphylococcus]UXR70572.1 GNAT family N-acetyltransferase [Staphylococcus sp. IVB6246]UXR72627.1 GNAT family N-acetyltransferase [Staphylococcus sp. IVB6240]UXR74931.1 GNAT family N-acetyltransferase [Staphylococcus sp. IVB6238]